MANARSHPLFLSPALPSNLLQFIIAHCSYPTTLIICGDRAEFLSSLTQDLLQQQRPNHPNHEAPYTTDEPHDLSAQQATADLSNPPQGYSLTTDPEPDQPPPEPRPQPQHQPETITPHQPTTPPHPLLTPFLSQISTTRHIRTVFLPTVTHLRAFLSVFSSSSPSLTKVPPPPPPSLNHRPWYHQNQ